MIVSTVSPVLWIELQMVEGQLFQKKVRNFCFCLCLLLVPSSFFLRPYLLPSGFEPPPLCRYDGPR